MISKGSVVNGSNMSELLQHFFSKRKGKAPAGFKLFVKGLEKINGSSVTAESGGKKKVKMKKKWWHLYKNPGFLIEMSWNMFLCHMIVV